MAPSPAQMYRAELIGDGGTDEAYVCTPSDAVSCRAAEQALFARKRWPRGVQVRAAGWKRRRRAAVKPPRLIARFSTARPPRCDYTSARHKMNGLNSSPHYLCAGNEALTTGDRSVCSKNTVSTVECCPNEACNMHCGLWLIQKQRSEWI